MQQWHTKWVGYEVWSFAASKRVLCTQRKILFIDFDTLHRVDW